MDYSELFEALEELEKERGIPKEYMLQKIEARGERPRFFSNPK